MDAFPVGLRPLGIDMAPGGAVWVANSGDDSVSITSVTPTGLGPKTLRPIGTVRGIPAPYAVALCTGGQGIVTSPSDGSVTVNVASTGRLTVKVGPEPYSAACYEGARTTVVVSTLGDNSLVLFEYITGSITARIPNVPGSRGFHGIGITADAGRNLAWVAGTDANVVTVVDLTNSRALAQIPLSRPTAVRTGGPSATTVSVASAGNGNVTTYDVNTLQVRSTSGAVPNVQDYAGSFLGIFFANGMDWVSGSEITVPGATSVAAADFGSPFGPSTSVAVVTSSVSNSVYLIQQAPSTPAQFSAANGAGFLTSQVAPGSLFSTFVRTGVNQNFSADSLPLPRTLGGVILRIGGSLNFSATSGWTYDSTGSNEAPLLFVGPGQINFQAPPGINPGISVPAQLTLPSSTLLTTLRITATSPGIFTVLQNGQGQAAALNPDYSQNGNPQSILGAKPARRGSFIQIFATGAGETDPPLLPGEPAPASGNPLILTRAQPTVTIGGQTARVLFSGMAPGFVGLWQINAEVPPAVPPGPAVPLVITAGGVSSNTVTIAVE